MLRLSIVLLAFIAHGTATADVYKCTGADGRLAFQAQPCPEDAREEAIEVDKRPGSYGSDSGSRRVSGGRSASDDGTVSLVGKWIDVAEPDEGHLEFTASGDASIRHSSGMSFDGTWRKTGDNRYLMDVTFQGIDLSSSISLDPSTGLMTVQMDGHPAATFRRM